MLHALLTYRNLGAALVSPGSSLGRFPLAMLDTILIFTASPAPDPPWPAACYAACMYVYTAAPPLSRDDNVHARARTRPARRRPFYQPLPSHVMTTFTVDPVLFIYSYAGLYYLCSCSMHGIARAQPIFLLL